MDTKKLFGRREILKTSAMVFGGTLLARESMEADPKGVNTNSSPSTLKITDMRVATIVKPGPSPCPIIRLDTNQGVYGLGEVRDGASATYALFLKSRIVGENPLQLDRVFRKIKQFGGHARQGGGVSAIEMALWDITGKVYNSPVYAMLGGGKFRDKIRLYADTTESKDPKIYAQRMKERKESMGITWLKMDLGIEMVADTPGTVSGPSGLTDWEQNQLPHPFVGMEVTDKGIAMLEQYVAAIRDAVGMEIPACHGPSWTSGREIHYSAQQGLREIQFSVAGGRPPLDLHGSVEENFGRKPHTASHWRGYLSERAIRGVV